MFLGSDGLRLAASPSSPAIEIRRFSNFRFSRFSSAAIVGDVDDDDGDRYHAAIRRPPEFKIEIHQELGHSSLAKAVNSRGDTVVATVGQNWSEGPLVVLAATGEVQKVPLPGGISPDAVQQVTIGLDRTIFATARLSDPSDDGTVCFVAKEQNGEYASQIVPVPGRKSGDLCYVEGGTNTHGAAAFTVVDVHDGLATPVAYVKNPDGTVTPYSAICPPNPDFYVSSLTGMSNDGSLIGRGYDIKSWTEVTLRITPDVTTLSSGR